MVGGELNNLGRLVWLEIQMQRVADVGRLLWTEGNIYGTSADNRRFGMDLLLRRQ